MGQAAEEAVAASSRGGPLFSAMPRLVSCLTLDPKQTNASRHPQHKHSILFGYTGVGGRRSCTRGTFFCLASLSSSILLRSFFVKAARKGRVRPFSHGPTSTHHPYTFTTGSEIAFLLDACCGLAKGRDRRPASHIEASLGHCHQRLRALHDHKPRPVPVIHQAA